MWIEDILVHKDKRQKSDWFEINRGLKQGYEMSLRLLNIFIVGDLRKKEVNNG